MKRRSFIKTSTLGAASLSTFSLLTSSREVSKNDKLGVALVGLGSYSTYQLAPALLETNHCYLSGIVTGTLEKEAIWADKYEIPDSNIYNYENFDEIANNQDIDVVYVVLPNSMHAEFTIRALEAGKHVICEKPMCTSYADAKKMLVAAKKANKRLFVGYRLHYDPFNLEMMRLGQKLIHGSITEISAGFGFPLRDKNRWRLDKKLAGGGPLMDVGIYALQGMIYTLGELPTSLMAKDTTVDKAFYNDVEGSLTWSFEFPSGVKNSLESSYEKEGFQYLRAKTENSTFHLSTAYVYGNLAGEANGIPFKFDPINQQAAQMDAQILDILKDRKSLTPGEMGARDMFIMEKIYESMATGEKVALDLMPKVQHLV